MDDELLERAQRLRERGVPWSEIIKTLNRTLEAEGSYLINLQNLRRAYEEKLANDAANRDGLVLREHLIRRSILIADQAAQLASIAITARDVRDGAAALKVELEAVHMIARLGVDDLRTTDAWTVNDLERVVFQLRSETERAAIEAGYTLDQVIDAVIVEDETLPQ